MDSPTIEICSIGTELVMGRIQDTNSCWIAGQVAQLGGQVRRITLVPDDRDDILACWNDGIARGADIVISTGGLGPTPDDVTAECLAVLMGTNLRVHEPTLEDYMRRRNLTSRHDVTPNLIAMATVPDGAEVLRNPEGWAPCIHAHVADTDLFVLPGPPREMQALFNLYIAGFLADNYTAKSASRRVLVNMFESEVSPLMQAVTEKFPGSYLKAYVALRQSLEHSLPVDIVATGPSASEAETTLHQAIAHFATLVADKGKTMEMDK
jgi:molybdenum cofactor synthesis domain-containing protein